METAKAPQPDCRRIVMRLRYSVKGGCDRRATSTTARFQDCGKHTDDYHSGGKIRADRHCRFFVVFVKDVPQRKVYEGSNCQNPPSPQEIFQACGKTGRSNKIFSFASQRVFRCQQNCLASYEARASILFRNVSGDSLSHVRAMVACQEPSRFWAELAETQYRPSFLPCLSGCHIHAPWVDRNVRSPCIRRPRFSGCMR
jgi:hypothetical protein